MLSIGVFGEAKQAARLASNLTDAIESHQWAANVRVNDPCDLNFLIGLSSLTSENQNWRTHLVSAGLPFHVLYGLPDECLNQAIGVINWQLEKDDVIAGKPMLAGKPWVWLCDKCSDPVCEHRLLSDLIAARART